MQQHCSGVLQGQNCEAPRCSTCPFPYPPCAKHAHSNPKSRVMVYGRNYPLQMVPPDAVHVGGFNSGLRGGMHIQSLMLETQLKSCENFLVWISLLLLNLMWVTTQTKVWESRTGCLKSLWLRNAFVLKMEILLGHPLTETGPLSILSSLKEIGPINLLNSLLSQSPFPNSVFHINLFPQELISSVSPKCKQFHCQ